MSARRKKKSQSAVEVVQPSSNQLLSDLRDLIQTARQGVARAIDSGLIALYWQIGQRIRQDILQEKRAEYGEEIVATLSRQLSWTHFVALIPLKDELQRDFYIEMCRLENWSTRTLRKKIQSMLFERTGLSKKNQTNSFNRNSMHSKPETNLHQTSSFATPISLIF